MKLDSNFFLKIISDWKHYWMKQTQNSKEDQQNYFNRAFGVDSNMKHHLADLMSGAVFNEILKNQPDIVKEVNRRLANHNADLSDKIKKLEKEIQVLRHYGNKDCTAMADEVLKNEK